MNRYICCASCLSLYKYIRITSCCPLYVMVKYGHNEITKNIKEMVIPYSTSFMNWKRNKMLKSVIGRI